MAAVDVAVIGLGAMGSAALYHLAKRGVGVVGIEQFTPGHDRGSSHGETRIIRLGYFEHPSYVPLVRAAFPLSRAIEPASGGVRVLTDQGVVEAGQAIVAAGPWVKTLLPDLPAPLRVTRQVLGWFEPSDAAMFARERCPVFMIENADGVFYGFPAGE